MAPYPGFINGTYVSQSPISDQEETINWYVEQMESHGATSKAALYPTPGYQTFATVTTVGGRAMFGLDRCFGVNGTQFYEIAIDGTVTNRGTVAIDANPATISSNGSGGDQLFITSGGNGYNYDLLTNTLTQITGLVATQGGFLYGYFVAFDATSSTVRLSDLFDGTTWDPTQFFQPTIPQDDWKSMLVTPYGQILLNGKWTGSFYYNAGTFPIPFAPDPSGLIEEGIAAPFSIKQASKSAVWLSTNKNGGYQVMRATGFTPQRISTHAIEFLLSQVNRIDDAIGETYEDQGHAFYLLTLPTAGITLCYDFNEGKWHKRGTWISENNAFTYLRPVFHCFAFNKHLMADRETGKIYQQDISFTMDVDNRPIRRVRRAPAVVNQNLRLFFPKFEVLLESGLGVNGTGAGSSPTVMMRKSNDGGQTWGNDREISAGKVGQYSTRVMWLNTGSGRKRVFEVSVTDAINNWRLTDAYLRVSGSSEAA